MADRSDPEVESEGGVTFGALCRMIFRWDRLVVILIVTVLAAAIASLVVLLAVNPSKAQYGAKFEYEIASVTSVSTVYESGQLFAEEETLTAVKNSSEKFAEVNIEEMLAGGEEPIVITRETEKLDDGISETYYAISVKGSLFPDKKTANAFLKALVGYAKDRAVNDAKTLAAKNSAGTNGYQAQLKNYESAKTYEEKLTALRAQRDYLTGLYQTWIDRYGDLYFIQSKGMTLIALKEAAQAALTDTMYGELSDELNANAYIPASEDNVTLSTRRDSYAEQLSLNKTKLEDLQSELDILVEKYKADPNANSSTSVMPQFGEFHSRIVALTEENATLQKKIDAIDMMLNPSAGGNTDYIARRDKFGASLQEVYEDLAVESEQIAAAAEEIASRESYTTILELTSSGTVNPILMAALAGVAAFLIASAVYCGVAMRSERLAAAAETLPKAEEKAKEEAKEEPASEK